jgi:hypothetical protein
MNIAVDHAGKWKCYWGAGPLPVGAIALGTVTRDGTDTGALLLMRTGLYYQGNAGTIRGLPQRKIREAQLPAGKEA